MVYLLLIILYITCFISYFEEKLSRTKWFLYLSIGILLVLIAGFRPIGIDNDSENYLMYFNHWDEPLFEMFVEYSFLIIAKVFHEAFGDVHSIFLLYALFGVSLKFIAIRQLTPLAFLAVAIYLGHYFILHELTQIRAGVASGFFLLSIKPLCEGKRWHAALFMLLALVFHYSSAILFPLLLLTNREITPNRRIVWAGLVPFAWLLYFLHIGIASLPIPFIGDKISMYDKMKEQGVFDNINVFNLIFLVKNIIYFYFLYMYDTIKEHNAYYSLMLKIMGISILSYLLFSSIPILAMRISELFGIVEIILFTNIYYTVRPSWLSKTVVLVISFVYLYLNLFHEPILKIS